jgi:hypothetical protein
MPCAGNWEARARFHVWWSQSRSEGRSPHLRYWHTLRARRPRSQSHYSTPSGTSHGPLKGRRPSRKIPMRSQRGRANAHASRPIDSLLRGATRRPDQDRRGERIHGKRCQEDEQHHTLPVTATATARMTPTADNPPTTEASQRTSRNSSHHRVSMTLLQHP